MARVVRFHEIGGPEVLRVEEVEVPPPGKGEVQIRIHALGLNRAEAMFRSGQYWKSPSSPPAWVTRRRGPSPRSGRASRASRSVTRSALSRASP